MTTGTLKGGSPGEAEATGSQPGLWSRQRVGRAVVVLAALGVLVAGGWGAFTALSAEAGTARVGEPVETRGGYLRVESVTAESLEDMHGGAFAGSGMNMSPSDMDLAPEGYRRFSVSLSAFASGRMDLRAGEFRVHGEDPAVPPDGIAPLRSTLGDGRLGPGESLSGSLLFEVPEGAEDLVLDFGGARRVALEGSRLTEEDAHGH